MISRPGALLVLDLNGPVLSGRTMPQQPTRHDIVTAGDWIEKVAAGSGGLGVTPSPFWVFLRGLLHTVYWRRQGLACLPGA